MNIDVNRSRHGLVRWYLLVALYNGRPGKLNEVVLLDTIRGLYEDVTQREIRRELDYLDADQRGLINVLKQPDGAWYATIGRFGIDLVEYAVDCDPGITRPPLA